MRLCLVLVPGTGEPPSFAALGPMALRLRPRLVPAGLARQAYAPALLGQDPALTWTGPAPFVARGAGVGLADDEAAYLLTPVRAKDGTIRERVACSPSALRDALELLKEQLASEAARVVPSDPPALVLPEPLVGPPALDEEPLVGRALTDLPAGPPALLDRVLAAGRVALAESGAGSSGATHLFPHSPGGPLLIRPLREAWPGLGPSAVVGAGGLAASLAGALELTHLPAAPGLELSEATAHAARYDLIVAVLTTAPAETELAPPAVALAVASEPDPSGAVALALRGPVAPGDGVDLLRPLALA